MKMNECNGIDDKRDGREQDGRHDFPSSIRSLQARIELASREQNNNKCA